MTSRPHFSISLIVLGLAEGVCSELQIAQLNLSLHCSEPLCALLAPGRGSADRAQRPMALVLSQ